MTPPTQGLGALILAAVAVLGFGAFLYRAWKLYRYLRLGWNEDRTQQLAKRVRDELVIYLFQRKLLKRPYYVRGLAHAFIFWGFIVITLGTTDLLLSGIFGLRLPGAESAFFVWAVDVFAAVFRNADQIASKFAASLEIVQSKPACGLRMVFRVDPPELAMLPWEYMFDQATVDESGRVVRVSGVTVKGHRLALEPARD